MRHCVTRGRGHAVRIMVALPYLQAAFVTIYFVILMYIYMSVPFMIMS